MRILKILALLSVFVITIQCFNNKTKGKENAFTEYNDKGELLRPKDYRSWVFAGTVTTPEVLDTSALFPDFQNIYIDPVGFKFWKKNGYFDEGTILVKELLRATDRRKLPIGEGFVQGKIYDIAATIKDTIKYPNVPGGWEYFDFSEQPNGEFTAVAKPVGNMLGCIACHSQAEAGYGPFPELYAPLRDAKGFGEGSPENLSNRNSLPSAKLKLLSK